MKNYTITVNGNTYQVQVEEGNTSPPVVTQSAPAQVTKVEAPKKSASAKGGTPILAPMSGKILGIKVKVGQSVKSGDPLIVLEAMKMENEIVAPKDGIVASVEVSVGDAVETSHVLATLQ